MSNSKKKDISDQIPKPISIKKEKTEEDRTLHPISHYIDDRLELVKQVFGTLKPKTIRNLAPEYLKKIKLDEIEELCLNELLCISTKRLKSIVGGTRCPTDTESSEDSDVLHKEEHISLEEISSDSDIGDSNTRRGRKKKKLAAKRAEKTTENQAPPGQFSVLELLELQARARAIRSQLAMEPITKIEVESDEAEEKRKQQPIALPAVNSVEHEHESSEQLPSRSSTPTPPTALTNGTSSRAEQRAAKKIKLKRNYRNATKSPEKEVIAATAEQSLKPTEDKSRSASPDVIPIQAEPETLLISDSTDNEEPPPPSPSPAKVANKATAQLAEPAAPLSPPPAPPPPAKADSEPEEGEVTEESETAEEAVEVRASEPEQPAQTAVKVSATEESEIASVPVEEAIATAAASEPAKNEGESATEPQVDDEDQNDDVISIGGDLENDMIEQLAKEEDRPSSSVKSEVLETATEPDEEDNDVISLDTSEDERDKLQEMTAESSWRTRYLKSSKVSQVLAASRLGKRVRDKIKKSNHSQKRSDIKQTAAEAEAEEKSRKEREAAQQQQQQFASKHEDGSVEQYQELLKQRPRKSSNSSKGEK